MLEVASKEAEKVDALEQYRPCQNLEIIGVPVTEKEDTAEIVLEVAKALDLPISRSDISIAHRLPTKPSRNENQLPQPPAIIARFVNRTIRNNLYSRRKETDKTDFSKFTVTETRRLFINENLTQLRKKLFWKAKQRVKDADFRFIWTNNGNIYVRKSESSNSIPIQNEQDIAKIL